MLPFEVTILGSSSATPTSERFPSAQVINVHGRLFLVDCGEACQIQLRKYGIRIQKIEHIFISHLHGDHIYGLPGLLGTMHLLGRTKELHIHSPEGIEEILAVLNKYSDTFLRFPIVFHVLDTKMLTIILDDDKLSVTTLPLDHRIACCGFLFREKPRQRNIIKEKMVEYNIPMEYVNKIRLGADMKDEKGTIIPNSELTIAPPPPRSYAYCSDTAFYKPLIDQIKNVDLLYHEATFTKELKARAEETSHSTAEDAAGLAQQAAVKKLIIGHFSARYVDLQPLLDEAKAVFPNTELAREGLVFKL